MRVLFVHQRLQSFVQKDLDILRSSHDVRDICFESLGDSFSLWQNTAWCDVSFSWFGKLHAFFAVLFSILLRKKSLVVAGGDDVVYEPEIKYGMFAYWWKKWCPLLVFRYTDLILSVSKFNRHETIKNAKPDPKKVKLLYHGFDPERWQPMNGIKKENMVLTVGHVNKENFRRKGLGVFVQSASHLPDVPFFLVGPLQDSSIQRLQVAAPPNVTFTGELDDKALVQMYSRAKVYVQASVHEAFGCSLAEAMLCECVPVVSRRAALPEVVGDCGFYCDDLSPQSLADRIRGALEASDEMGRSARARIKQQFPLSKRCAKLLALIDSLGGSKTA